MCRIIGIVMEGIATHVQGSGRVKSTVMEEMSRLASMISWVFVWVGVGVSYLILL